MLKKEFTREAALRAAGLVLCLVAGASLLFERGSAGNAPAASSGIVNENGPLIALTFDDGPYAKVTSHILDVLEENGVPATFFVLGSRIQGREDALLRMEELGCEIGNHGFTHADLTTLSQSQCKQEIEDANEELERVLGHGADVVRPPYGRYNDTVRKAVPYPLVLWTLDANDWHSRNPSELAKHVVGKAQEGSVILLHDLQSSTASATDTMIPALIKAGFRFVTISELIEKTGGDCAGIIMP